MSWLEGALTTVTLCWRIERRDLDCPGPGPANALTGLFCCRPLAYLLVHSLTRWIEVEKRQTNQTQVNPLKSVTPPSTTDKNVS